MFMAPTRLVPCLYIFFTICFSLVASKPEGLSRSLIPPTSPRSPFYPLVLKANNISSSTKNITLDRTHYREWLMSSKYSEISFRKVAGYVMDMFIGDPLQYVFGTFDTGSELVWFQCEGQKPGPLPNFNQSKSSSYKEILCGDEKRCDTTKDEIVCDNVEKPCGFKAVYVDGTAGNGNMATDAATLSTATEALPELRFGCSSSNSRNVMGIIGAGIGEYSLPNQLYPNDPKFSYCISYDISTNMVNFGAEADLAGLSTEVSRAPDSPLYYLDVLSIQVNGKDTDVAPDVFEMSSDGTRGFIIDSGTAITALTSIAFDALKKRMVELLGPPTTYSMFEICYPPSQFSRRGLKQKPSITVHFPEFAFVLPTTGTWELQKKANLVCLLIQRTQSLISVLGYEQLFDVNVGHDPNNNKVYLLRTKCPSTDDI